MENSKSMAGAREVDLAITWMRFSPGLKPEGSIPVPGLADEGDFVCFEGYT